MIDIAEYSLLRVEWSLCLLSTTEDSAPSASAGQPLPPEHQNRTLYRIIMFYVFMGYLK